MKVDLERKTYSFKKTTQRRKIMRTQITKCVSALLVVTSACVVCAQEMASAHIKEIFALAKTSAEEDFNVNFCGFFVGMSRHDAADLASYYHLKEGEYFVFAEPGKAVSRLWFSLKGVRRITKGGNTLDELAQAVANQVGELKGDWKTKEYTHKTIDGVFVKFGGKGLSIHNDQAGSQAPRATVAAAQKDKDDVVAAEKAPRSERAAKEALPRLIKDMVAIPGKDFKIGKYEVTQAQWQAVMGENPSAFKCVDNPVEKVSWDDCKKFLEKLNALPEVKASGLRFRLPTTAEWKYACRAGERGDYCRLADGTEITKYTLGKVAWYEDNGESKTHPVGQKEPNAFGLYDMLGNVWEWLEDSSWLSKSNRELGGGSWSDPPWDCTITRDRPPDCRYAYIGFRLAASQD